MSTLGLFNEVLLLLFPLLILILITSLSKKKGAHCLKITQNVAFELLKKDAGLWLAKQFWDPPGDV